MKKVCIQREKDIFGIAGHFFFNYNQITSSYEGVEDRMKILSPIAAKCGNIRIRSELGKISMKFL
ncbi:hypothetical protein LBYZC6_33210 [Lacrimispora brassicae]